MLGDMDVDLSVSSAHTRSLKEFLNEFDMNQLITSPARISSHSQTLIDHIYVNNTHQYIHQGVVNPGLSDHGIVFVTRKHIPISKAKETIFVRDYRFFDELAFARDISEID